ncbi:type IV pilin [Gloeomargarita lithophora Alchichica-D10]|uniref:Type IV pilin n=1 Tax=Gloeomargarita lithophora Alchichica-D10 TaxID=1188229 RepID=A0A1J0AG43_9CYAN|nr:hypothetical protein [Gloeomargarita lithophora]APB34875.1 type IV pilin [Gloeomargarita lithophora Alchichica-D10]
MNKRLLLSLFKARRSAQAGFTVAELVVGAAIGAFLITGMMYLVVEMTRIERTQTARGETEREMAQSLDYISAELKEAVLVYDQSCLGATGTGAGASCPNLTLPTNTVLAFWKREAVPDLNFLSNVPGSDDQDKIQNYASACATQDCTSVMDYVRTQYTLVTYVLCPNTGRPGPNCGFTTTIQPRGPARITRGYFRQYVWGTGAGDFQNRLTGLEPLDNPTWPGSLITWGGPNSDTAILVANVDWEPPRVDVNCPTGYVASTGTGGTNTGFSSFYACVRQRTGAAETGFVQDVFVTLRGNAAERAGLRDIEATGTNIYRPAVETQVRTRGSYNRVPN